MFKRIMVTVDSGKAANIALDKAIELAKEQKAQLFLVHVLDYSAMNTGGEGVDLDALREHHIKIGKKALAKVESKAKKKKIKTSTLLEEPQDLLSNVAD